MPIMLTMVLTVAGELPHCVDPPPSAALECGRIMEHVNGMPADYQDEVETLLCPSVAAIQRASCASLGGEASITQLIGTMPLLRATANTTRDVNFNTYSKQKLFTGLYLPGIVHDPADLAKLLLHFAKHEHLHTHQALRFVSTNSNNGWVAILLAAYLARVHAPAGFHGLAVNGLKTEWATVRNVRVLLDKVGLSWRVPEAFDAPADAALMTYHPHVRNSLGPTAYAKASILLPVSWVGLPPPFDVCVRLGDYGREAVLTDLAMLGGWCREFVYHGAEETDAREIEAALATAHGRSGGRLAHPAKQVGAFVVISSNHLREASHESLGDSGNSTHAALTPLSNMVPFSFVNKTPPAASELYTPYCMQDMAGCNWHRGVPAL